MRLRSHSACRINEQDGDVAIGRCHRHVSRVLLVTRCICNEHSAAIGQIHMAIGDVDGDALLALGLQSVGEQRVVDVAQGHGRTTAAGATRVLELVARHAVGLSQQPPDQGGLAIVD